MPTDTPPRNADALLADGLMTVKQAASWLGVAQSTLYLLMDRGGLPFIVLPDVRARRIPKRALLDLAQANLRGWNGANT